MRTSYVLKARVEKDGSVKVEEKVPLPPGPVEVSIVPVESGKPPSAKGRGAKIRRHLKRIWAIKCPPVPRDGKTVDDVLYGP
ncbi:MAG: hypothetical protein M5U26_03345 [Planctomycetota bacterium]|nr:hypothetical protein [Planctomycetota bacterium]